MKYPLLTRMTMISARDRDRMFQRAVGLLLVASLVALLWFTRMHRQSLAPFDETIRLETEIMRADGIATNAPVTLAGLKVGRVQGIDLTEDNRIRVTLEVDARLAPRLRQDAVATVMRPVLGTASVEIDPGSAQQPEWRPGQTLAGRVQPDLNEILATLPARLAKVDATLDNLTALSADMRRLSQAATTGSSSVEKTLVHLQATSRQAEIATGKLADTLDETRGAIRQALPTLAKTQQVVDDVGAALRQLPVLTDKVDTVLDDVKVFTDVLRSTAPQLPPLAVSGRNAAEEADEILGAARRSVWLRSSFPAPAPLPQLPSSR